MAIVRYDRAIASVSWVDRLTDLPEVDADPPGGQVTRAYLTGTTGFRFVNYLEVWAHYDTVGKTIVGHGYSPASTVYRSPSYRGFDTPIGDTVRDVQAGHEPIVFYQMAGARTESRESVETGGDESVGEDLAGGPTVGRLGGGMGPKSKTIVETAGRYRGSIDTRAVAHFPPIWTELELKLYNNGRMEVRVLRYSLFPSVSFYLSRNDAPGAPIAYLYRVPQRYGAPSVGMVQSYNGVPNLKQWMREGWGPIRGTGPGPTAGNPWALEEPVFGGLDHRRFGGR